MAELDLSALRVLAFCDYFSSRSSGGAERVAAEVLARLERQGAEICVVSACPPGLLATDDPVAYDVTRVRAFDLSRILGAQLAFAPSLGRRVRDAITATRPTVLYAHSLHFQGTVVAARLAARTGLPLVTTAHLGSSDELSFATRVATMAYEKTVGRYVLSRSRSVIAVSNAVASHLVGIGGRPSTISVVENGVDHNRFHPADRSVSSKRTKVAFVGRLIANKGPEVFLAALLLLVQRGVVFDAWIIGDGPLRGRLENLVVEAGLGSVVRFAGQVDDVAERLREIDVLVRPSLTEGLPLALLEAMATKVCVVASSVPGNVELIGDNERGRLFPAGDTFACANAIEEMVRHPELRRAVATAGHAYSQNYSWDRCAAEVGELLASVSGAN